MAGRSRGRRVSGSLRPMPGCGRSTIPGGWSRYKDLTWRAGAEPTTLVTPIFCCGWRTDPNISLIREETSMEDQLTSPYQLTPPIALIVVVHRDGITGPLYEVTGHHRPQGWCLIPDTPARQAEMLAAVR